MSKTLLLSDIFPPKTGGSGRWFWEIYSRLPTSRFVIAAGEDARQTEFDRDHDLTIVRMPLSMEQWGIRSWRGLSDYWSKTARLRQIIKSHDVTAIHCGRVLPEGVMSLVLKWRMGLPFLCYVHGEDITTARDSREHAFLVGRVLRAARLLIANSENTCRILVDQWQIPKSKVVVLHPGVDAQRFSPASPCVETRHRLDWNGRKVLLTVGRLQKRKGHDQMIRAISLLKSEFPNLLYSIVGDGEERPELETLIKNENLHSHVQLRGETDDGQLISCYQQCDLFVLPNRQVGRDIEGFGMVLLEAQACGKPVIAGKSGGTAEAVNAPHSGLVASCETPEGIAAAVRELLRDPQRLQAMGQRGRRWAADHFDWSALTTSASECFERLAPAGMLVA